MTVDPNQLVEDLLKDGFDVEKSVDGTSMMPTIPPASLVRITPISSTSTLKLGDIVLTRSEFGKFRVHRISMAVKRNGTTHYQTWGDNSRLPDPLIASSEILGKVTAYSADTRKWQPIRYSLFTYIKLFSCKYLPFYVKRLVSL